MPPSDFAESCPSIADEIPAILASLERIELRQQKSLVEIMIRLNAIEAAIASSDDDESSDPGDAPPRKPEMDWEAQKRKIFEAHGMPVDEPDPEAIPPAESADPVQATDDRSYSLDAGQTTDDDASIADPPAQTDLPPDVPTADLEEITRLKNELREKLRQAEMELSISRAKISRENAMLEERKAELEQMAERIRSQSRTDGQEPQKLSMLDRLNRHMKTLKRSADADPE